MENDKTLYQVSSSPHIRSADTTRGIMLDVITALLPALAVSVYAFGMRTISLTLVSMLACMFFEWAYRRLMKKDNTVSDLSAAVTGMLLAYCLPPSAPYWLPVVGAFFAIVIVKQLFGGIGKNFMNPALSARAFLLSWPVIMTTWPNPLGYGSIFNFFGQDIIAGATPLSYLKQGLLPEHTTIYQLFIGTVSGSLGEISAVALILGGVYLIFRKVISWKIPVSFIATVAVLTFIFPQGDVPRLQWMSYELLSGGLLLGAIFMATDYVTSPVTGKGKLIFGAGCGLITVFIRYFGSYTEGVSYAILIMNTCVWLIDKSTMPKRFGSSSMQVGKEEKA